MSRKAAEKANSRASRTIRKPDRTPPKSASKAKGDGKPAKAGIALTAAEEKRLGQLETAIGSGLTSFVEVGRALRQINADRLYRRDNATFEDYCAQKWGLSRQHGYRLIKAADSFDLLQSKLPKGALLPGNESQLRPLEHLNPKQAVKAWEQALKDSLGVKVTAEVVEKAVRELDGSSKPHKPAARKTVRANVPTKTVAKIVEVAQSVLKKPNASSDELRKVLEKIRDRLKRLTNGTAP